MRASRPGWAPTAADSARGLAQVGLDDLDLDRDGPLDQLAQLRRGRHEVGGVGALDEGEDLGVGDEAALEDLAEPRDELLAGQRLEQGQVADDPGGLVEGADEVLAGAGVDPGLAADRGVDHGQQRGRHVDDADAAGPGGRHEAAEVGGGTAADGDDRVGTGEAALAEGLPAVGGHGRGLGELTVGQAEGEHVVVLDEPFGDRLRDLAELGGEEHRHPFGAGAEQVDDAVEDVVADHDVVGRRAPHGEHRRLRAAAHASSRTISAATSSGVRPSVSTTRVATDS